MTLRSPGRIRDVQTAADRAGRLPTGVEGQNVPTDFSIPPVGLTDVDRAVFDLFDKRLAMQVTAKGQTQKVDVLLAGGERFALAKRNRPVRDKNGAVILPLVAIRRTGLDQSALGPIPGRGMPTDTGDLVIRRRIAREDPQYQSLINKLRLKNQDNVAGPDNMGGDTAPQGSDPGTVASRRYQPKSFNTVTGELLAPDLGKNIFEVITIPFPHFYAAMYEVTFWAQYTKHMNQMVERFMSGYDAQRNQYRLDTPKGYWFVAYVDDNFKSDDNFEDYSNDERIVKVTFSITVPAYMHAMKNPGDPVPFRRFLSAPQVSFGLYEGTVPVGEGGKSPVGSGDKDKFTLNDVTQLDKRGDPVLDTRTRVEHVSDEVVDPFTGKGTTRLLRVVSRNQRSGETVISKRVSRKVGDINL